MCKQSTIRSSPVLHVLAMNPSLWNLSISEPLPFLHIISLSAISTAPFLPSSKFISGTILIWVTQLLWRSCVLQGATKRTRFAFYGTSFAVLPHYTKTFHEWPLSALPLANTTSVGKTCLIPTGIGSNCTEGPVVSINETKGSETCKSIASMLTHMGAGISWVGEF